MKKKLIACIVACVAVIAAVSIYAASGRASDSEAADAGNEGLQLEVMENPFKDVSDDAWYKDSIDYVYNKSLMSGVEADMFAPDGNITRGMAVAILYRMEGSPAVAGKVSFEDVLSGSYYENAISWASESGIVGGYSETAFGPDDNITREQFAAVLYRYFNYKGGTADNVDDLAKFTDSGDVSGYAKEAIGWAAAKGLISGTSETTLSPQGITTRAQAAAIFMRYDTLFGGNSRQTEAPETKSDEKSEKNAKVFKVVFQDYDGTVLKTEEVEEGKSATPPANPKRSGYVFTNWSEIYTNVTGDVTTIAEYREESAVKPGTSSRPSQDNTQKEPDIFDKDPEKENPSDELDEQDTYEYTEPEDRGISTPYIDVSSVKARPGDSNVEVEISVHNNPGILGMTLSVMYDDSVLTLKNASEGSALSVLTMTKPGQFVSQCRFIWDGQEIESSDIKDGVILNLYFDVSSSAPAGKIPIRVFFNDNDIIDNDLSPIDFTAFSGGIVLAN